MPQTPDLIALTACEVVDLLRSGEVTPLDLLDALEQRIGEVDGRVNALPTLCLDRARDAARRLENLPAEERGALAGLPVPIKDLTDVAGVRSTQGSLVFADHIPEASSPLVSRIEGNGGVIYAKSNSPEFGAGAHTFNEVHGVTRNPYDLTRSAGGSSGGAAVALATGTAWVAHGSDMAGSLRTPSAFCGVVGLRPSPGRVPTGGAFPFQTLSVNGPMARNVSDCALLLDSMTGILPGAPLSLPAPETSFLDAARRPSRPARIAVSPDLGITPLDPQIRMAFDQALEKLERDGIELVERSPDFTGLTDAFQTLRSIEFAMDVGPLLADHRDKIKPEVVWNTEEGLKVTAPQLIAAQEARGRITASATTLLQEVDAFICPTAIVPSFDADQRHVARCDGVEFKHYFEWLAIVYGPTITGLPVISLPTGFTESGIPMGIQMLAPARDEAGLLSKAAYLEQLFGWPGKPVTPVG